MQCCVINDVYLAKQGSTHMVAANQPLHRFPTCPHKYTCKQQHGLFLIILVVTSFTLMLPLQENICADTLFPVITLLFTITIFPPRSNLDACEQRACFEGLTFRVRKKNWFWPDAAGRRRFDPYFRLLVYVQIFLPKFKLFCAVAEKTKALPS